MSACFGCSVQGLIDSGHSKKRNCLQQERGDRVRQNAFDGSGRALAALPRFALALAR
jgi:hypothetical protein